MKLPTKRSSPNNETKVSNGIKGHQYRKKHIKPKQYFDIHGESFD